MKKMKKIKKIKKIEDRGEGRKEESELYTLNKVKYLRLESGMLSDDANNVGLSFYLLPG